MQWLTYSDSEVDRFHPVFEQAATDALRLEGLEGKLEWRHHLRTPGNKIVPDFVLCDKSNGRWRLAVEIKRTKASLHSIRNQIQAKGYAENNADLFNARATKYFAISNLEQTILFALRADAPPSGCRLINGDYDVGSLNQPEVKFRRELTEQIRQLCKRILSEATAEFEEVWPSIISNFINHADVLVGAPAITEPDTRKWKLVRDYFCHTPEVDSARVFLLRCIFAEYIRGLLERFGHSEARRLLPLEAVTPSKIGSAIANVLSRLREIDFRSIFEDTSFKLYSSLHAEDIQKNLASYIKSIVSPPTVIGDLARQRLDRSEFLSGMVSASHAEERLDERGKVITDPELAMLLSSITVDKTNLHVLDPCCGDGALLEAVYGRLTSLSMAYDEGLRYIHGIEADPLFVRLASMRLLMKEPAEINVGTLVDITQGDMFASAESIGKADVILMNPPFRRYEAQDESPVPDALKDHYATEISRLSRKRPISISGQQNFYTYYVEFIIYAAKEECRLGIILDNKWFHNIYAAPLRKFFLEHCTIEAIVEYPYSNLFADWTISTSVVVCRKKMKIPSDHKVRFMRCSLDLSQVDMLQVADNFERDPSVLRGWSVREIAQGMLDYRDGWKNHFATELRSDFRLGLLSLDDLFEYKRRGSLAKEEGGMSALAFPFSRATFGHVRKAVKDGRRYETERIRKLSRDEDKKLRVAASLIKKKFKGYAINNADVLSGYMLTEAQALEQPTIEPPSLRGNKMFWNRRKTGWTKAHKKAVAEIIADSEASDFIKLFRRVTGLSKVIMPEEWLWVAFKEPYAGELIIPRKLRSGHRVHINPFACKKTGRQVRISSNFVTYSNCRAVDRKSGLDCLTSVKIIAAFLISSFGQLQFEMNGYNREGLLSVELTHLEKLRLPDPRMLKASERTAIVEIFDDMPYPIPTNIISSEVSKRNLLDDAFGNVLCRLSPVLQKESLLEEVHALLDEYLLARKP